MIVTVRTTDYDQGGIGDGQPCRDSAGPRERSARPTLAVTEIFMAIEFTCPNGHRLSTKDDDAGKQAKCPKCGAVTKVPGLNGSASGSTAEPIAAASASGKGLLERSPAIADAGPAKSGLRLGGSKVMQGGMGQSLAAGGQATAVTDSGKSTSVAPGSAREESIVFLCPNGHKLNAPRRMQGRGGQCPHCGAKFIIPNVEEAALGDEGSTIETPDGLSGTSGIGALTPTGGGQSSATSATATAPVRHASDDYQPWATPPEEPQQHPLAALVMRLWSEREHGGVIELHMAGGAILRPDWFDRRLSQGPHGLFAAQAADGTVTMTIIPWETITRVVVHGVVGLPDGMFE
jgi:hypothetical protein